MGTGSPLSKQLRALRGVAVEGARGRPPTSARRSARRAFSKYPPEPRDCWNRPTWWKKIKSIFFFEPREKSLARAVLAMGVDESRRFGGSSRSHAHPLRLLGRVQVPTHHAQSLSVSPDRDTRTKRARSPHRSLVIFKERAGTTARGNVPAMTMVIAARHAPSSPRVARGTSQITGPRERPDPRRGPT